MTTVVPPANTPAGRPDQPADDQPTGTVAALAPALVRGADPATAAGNVARLSTALAAVARGTPDLRLVVLPAGCLSGGAGTDVPWPADALLAGLADAASGAGIWIAGADCFAGASIGFVLAPDAGVVLAQASIGEGAGAAELAFADTPVGRLACLVDGDLLHPEYARLALFGGAEIIVNPATEALDERSDARRRSRGARAWENHAVVVTASLGSVVTAGGQPDPAFVGCGELAAWNYTGQALVVREGATAATFPVDLAALRRRRAEPWINFPAQLRTGVYAGAYARAAADGPAPPAAAATAPEPYDVLMLQSHELFINEAAQRDAVIADNLRRALMLARPFCSRPTTRLLILPEFALQGSDGSHPLEYWERVGIRIPGPETSVLADFARECQVYLCAMVFEYDPDWPLRYFNTSLILSPEGEVILRYRKLQCADLNGLLNITTPGNVFSSYVERYGYDALMPVVDTPIGRLGSLICYDANWPELWRGLAMKGAEVICNPTSEIHSDRRPYWYSAKRAHAAENMVYVAMANAGSEQFGPQAPVTGMNRGHSALIDYNGALAAYADGPGVIPLLGRIDIGALRRARARQAGRPGAFRPAAVAAAYAAFEGFPLDCFLDTPMREPAEGPALVRAHIERLFARGVFRAA